MNNSLNLEKLILELVYADGYQPLKPRTIAKKLKLIDEERAIKKAIKKLVRQDRLAYGSKHLVTKPSGSKSTSDSKQSPSEKPKRRQDEITGVFRRTNAGFGFVTPQDSTATDRSADIFIPKHKTLDAADLDVVRIRVSRGHRGKRDDTSQRISGRIIEVLQRHTHRFVGTYQEHSGYGFVLVDGAVFESGILVGDAGAKNCKVGDKVVIELVRFPSDRQDGEGVIAEVLGDRGKPGVDTLSVIRQYGLPEDFPESVLENAREQAEAFDDTVIPPSRRDFTNATVITIDPKTARDFDDAISLQRLENGHWELGVHIADVSHFVPSRSELDNEAYQRGTSVYLPDRVIPMLPEIISNNLASLQPDRVRFCLTAIIEFSDAGVPVSSELFRGAIKSCHRFNYEEIDDYLADDKPWKKKLAPEVFTLVRDMHGLAMTLRKRRLDGGSINLVLPEIKIDLDDHGKVCGAHEVEYTESHQIIEEFMLAANIAVAQRLIDEKLFLLRRVHPLPTEAKLRDLTEFVRGLGIESGSLQDRFEMKRVIEESEDTPQQHAIHYAVLRSMQKAVYSPEEIGHYALNADSYCHFTSPIRRYPDLIIHRMVGDLIDGKRPKSNFDQLLTVGKHCSELEKRAADAERELTKLKLLNFMANKVGESLHAVITGVEAFGIFAQGIEIPAEGMIPVANLPEDSYQYDRGSRTLAGFKKQNQFRLGDQCEVRVALVDPDQRLMEFELLGVRPSSKNITNRSRRKTTSPRKNQPNGNSEKPSQSNKSKTVGDWQSVRASGPQKGHKKAKAKSPSDKSGKSSRGKTGKPSRKKVSSKSSSKSKPPATKSPTSNKRQKKTGKKKKKRS